MKKNNQLLTYREYGYADSHYYDYRFFVTEDYHCGLTLKAKTGDQEAVVETPLIELNPNEMGAVCNFCRQLFISDVKEKKVNSADSYSIILQGSKEFKEDLEMKKRMDEVLSFIRKQHDELGQEKVSELYQSLLAQVRVNSVSNSGNTK